MATFGPAVAVAAAWSRGQCLPHTMGERERRVTARLADPRLHRAEQAYSRPRT